MNIRPEDVSTLSRTIYGEARGESLRGKIAVAHVVLNRVRKPGWWSRIDPDDVPEGWPEELSDIPNDTIQAVCRRPWQFSMWNPGDPNRAKVQAVNLTDKTFRDCAYAALAAVQGHEQDPTCGATHYHARYIERPDWVADHMWSGRLQIGNHIFYPEN